MALSTLKIRVAIVDDHPLVVEGLKSLLKGKADIKVVYSCGRGEDLLGYLKSSAV